VGFGVMACQWREPVLLQESLGVLQGLMYLRFKSLGFLHGHMFCTSFAVHLCGGVGGMGTSLQHLPPLQRFSCN